MDIMHKLSICSYFSPTSYEYLFKIVIQTATMTSYSIAGGDGTDSHFRDAVIILEELSQIPRHAGLGRLG